MIEEVQEARLQVIGKLPKDLDGVFVRIGPNPALTPTGDYHCGFPGLLLGGGSAGNATGRANERQQLSSVGSLAFSVAHSFNT